MTTAFAVSAASVKVAAIFFLFAAGQRRARVHRATRPLSVSASVNHALHSPAIRH
jgi:hypothetical protein